MTQMAVVKIGGSQYEVIPGQEILVDRLVGDKGQKVILDQVLALDQEGQILLGQPRVAGVKIQAVIKEQLQGRKIRVAVYKAKSRYRKVKGFRPKLTKLEIQTIQKEKS
jgi:large subunit ribosomal protein L21